MKKYNKIVINGRFLSQKLTGVQRYALEITKALDSKLDGTNLNYEIAIPKDVTPLPELKNIKTVIIGKKTSLKWEQFELPFYLRKSKALCVNFCNSVPLLFPKGIVCVHDITYKINPQFITTKHLFFARIWHLIQYRTALKKSIKVFTVSEYSKNEIIKTYHINKDKISVGYNGWQHLLNIKVADTSLEKEYPKLKKNDYFFSVATAAKNKNFPWIVEAAKTNTNSTFVVAGKIDIKKLGNNFGNEIPDNLILLGYVSDENVKLLIQNCKAFVFPSLYEGFGIPPLEALSSGKKVICSNTSCLPEIFKDTVYYINPYEAPPDLDKLLEKPVNSPEQLLQIYDWDKTATQYLTAIEKIFNSNIIIE